MEKQRYLYIDGESVLVSEEVYRAFVRPIWREKKRREREKERGSKPLSLDAFTDAGFDIPSRDLLVEEIVADKLLLDLLMDALGELTAEERRLIDALYYNEQTEREYARVIGLSQKGVNKRRHRIIEKLRELLGG